MKATWQVQEAKSRFSELLEQANRRGAQVITRHGHPVAVVVSAEEYSRLSPRRKIVDILREYPLPGLEVSRLRDTPRNSPFEE